MTREEMIARLLEGETAASIGRAAGVTRQRVWQIVKDVMPMILANRKPLKPWQSTEKLREINKAAMRRRYEKVMKGGEWLTRVEIEVKLFMKNKSAYRTLTNLWREGYVLRRKSLTKPRAFEWAWK